MILFSILSQPQWSLFNRTGPEKPSEKREILSDMGHLTIYCTWLYPAVFSLQLYCTAKQIRNFWQISLKCLILVLYPCCTKDYKRKKGINDKGCARAPDWIIEVTYPSSTRMDYAVKLFKYRTTGVREYWLVNSMKKVVQT